MSSQNIYVEPEEKSFVLVYDLPSENQFAYKNDKTYSKVRGTRVSCTYKLHSLGVECTQSVILVPESNKDKIPKVIKEVFDSYKELNNFLAKNNFPEIDMPIIKAIEISVKQKEDFKTIAQRTLKDKLDKAIDRLATLINELDNILEEEKRKRIRYNLMKQKRELDRIEKFAKELGIETNHKFELLTELYNEAINKLESELV